ncbi:alpha/beta fold hydrolase [Leptolyngbya sp. AN02str]|uniref:alpha/beta fold hydrolase n=1 Tax=Leptolyngbya sp. AN02str TaxID=3423363 RepID=UPI003D31821D
MTSCPVQSTSTSTLRFRTPLPQNPEAPLFVFLPGMDGTGELLRLQLESLGMVFDIRCLVIPPDDLTNWDELACEVITLILHELERNPRQQVYLCGESFGGCLSLKVAQKSAEMTKPNGSPLLDYLTLVNPASALGRVGWLHSLSGVARWLPHPTFAVGCYILFPFLGALHRMPPEVAQELLRATQSISPESAYWRVDLIRSFQMSPQELNKIEIPTLVVASGGDRLLPSVPEAQHLIQHIPTAEMHVLPYSGHTCLLEPEVHLHDILAEHGALDGLVYKQTIASP